MPRYDVFLEGRAESSTCYFSVAVIADDQKEAEYLGHEAGRKKHRECDEIEVVGVMPVISALNSVDEAPTIDPESLRGHAKWVKDKELKFIIVDDENNSHEEPAIRCTHCNAKISQSDFDSWVWNFCPVCGFKMEDETEEQHETD